MTKYKIYVIIDDSNFFWIVLDNKKLIKNPIKEDFKGAILISYDETNICPRCRDENNITDKSILYPGNAHNDVGKNGKKTEEWVCKMHSLRHYHRYNPGSNANIRKSMADRRTGNLKNITQILGDKCEEETYRLFGAKKLSSEYDNYRLSFDHDYIPKGIEVIIGEELVDLSEKKPQTKGGLYNHKYKWWTLTRLNREWSKKFDILIFYCISGDGKRIEKIYIFPYSEIMKRTFIGIYKYDSKGNPSQKGWYEKYIIRDENCIDKANKIWYELI